MNPIHAGLRAEEYRMPDGITSATIDTKSGMLASSLTPSEYVKTELFNKNYVPKQESDVWQYIYVCPTSGQLMCDQCPGAATTKLALVRHEPWIPIISEEQPELAALKPADASLEVNEVCEVHGGEGALSAQNITLSGNGNYNTSTGVLESVNLTWSAAQGNITYVVNRATYPDFSDGETLDMVSVTAFTDSNPNSNTTSYYKIDALDSSTSEQLGSSTVISVAPQTTIQQQPVSSTPEVEQPTKPTTQVPTQEQPKTGTVTLTGTTGDGIANLHWNAPGNGNYQYYLFRNGSQIGIGSDITVTSYVDKEVQNGLSYTYFVICVDRNTHEEVCRSTEIQIQM